MTKVAVGIITINSQVLVCQRKRTSRYPLKWEFPGGKFENGESVDECLRRELREELSINAVVGKEFFRQEWVYPDSGPDSGSFEVFYHLVPSYAGIIRNNVFEQIRWINFSELARLDMLEGNKGVVEQLVKANINGKIKSEK